MTLTVWDAPAEPIMAQPERAVVRLPQLDEVARKWVRIEPMLARATERTGAYQPIDVLQLAFAGRLAIWFCETEAGRLDAVMVTTVQQYPRRRILEVLALGGGNMRAWLRPAARSLMAHAKQLGCDAIIAIGRPGLARACGGVPTGDIVVERRIS